MEVRRESSADNSSTPRQSSSLKQPKHSPSTVDTSSVTQRLQKELMSLMMSSGDLGVSAFPQGESIFTWIGTIEGGKGTMYEGLSYKLSLHFPVDYPFKPPQVKFETICFHPNVDQFGNICLDILQVKTITALRVLTILRNRIVNSLYLKQQEVMSLVYYSDVYDKWSSAYDVRTILLSIQSLLGEPNNESPLNSYAAALWSNKEEYRKKVQKQCFAGGIM